MGTGPLVLPPAVANAGFSLSLIALFFMLFISVICAEYMIECLAAANAIDSESESEIQMQNMEQDLTQQSLNCEKFDFKKPYEYGSLGKKLWGKSGEACVVISLLLYLYGMMITKGIIVGNTISILFEGIDVLDKYYFWVTLFYCLTIILSFKDVGNIAIVSTIFAIIRYSTILAMITGALLTISYNKQINPQKEFNISDFSDLFGAIVLAYVLHHSLPSMVRPCRPQEKISSIIYIAFIGAFTVFILLSLTGMWAFSDLQNFQYYNLAFDQGITSRLYYFISFYIFLNISALPVMTITIRKNMMKLCLPEEYTTNLFKLSWISVSYTLLVLVPCFILAITLKNHIQPVISIVGGVFGVVILMIIPSLMVIEYRKRITESNPFGSYIRNKYLPYLIVGLGCVFAPFNLYIQMKKIIQQ
ncbi:hypothetical protein pb186bvf_002529 [Paramecium bursaria]